MSQILGKKIGMSQIFQEDGKVLPITVIEGGPCTVLDIKTVTTHGYNALQLGFEDIKEERLKKPIQGHFKKIKAGCKRLLREIRIDNCQDYKVGQQIDVTQFNPGDFVDVIGTSRGLGFQGGIKRWHWKRGPMSHGSMSHRAPGSIGASSFPSRVFKGHHMPGHMGNQQITLQNLEVIKVDKDNNLLVVKGSVPGHRNSYLVIKTAKKKKAKAVKKQQAPLPPAKGQKPPEKAKPEKKAKPAQGKK